MSIKPVTQEQGLRKRRYKERGSGTTTSPQLERAMISHVLANSFLPRYVKRCLAKNHFLQTDFNKYWFSLRPSNISKNPFKKLYKREKKKCHWKNNSLEAKNPGKILVKKNSERSFFHLEIRAEEKILFFRYFFCEIRLFYRTKNWRGKKSARNHFAPVSIFRNFYHPIIYGLKMKRGRRKSMKEVSSWRWNESEI